MGVDKTVIAKPLDTHFYLAPSPGKEGKSRNAVILVVFKMEAISKSELSKNGKKQFWGGLYLSQT